MLNIRSIKAVDESTFSSNFVKPLYDSYCFSNISQAVLDILLSTNNSALPDDVLGTSQPVERVVLLVVDGLGWEFIERFMPKYPFLQELAEKGMLSKLTTQFPSTTSAALTTIYSTKPVGDHGVYEWNYYEPKLDAIISPIPFSFAGKKNGTKVLNTLGLAGIDPDELLPEETLSARLKLHGISSHAFMNKNYLNSPYGSMAFKNSIGYGFSSFEEGCIMLREKLLHSKEKGYYYLYYEKIDHACHKYGPNSVEFEEAVKEFCCIMETVFMDKLEGKLHNTLFMMTADHGQVSIDPEKTVYLNKDLPEIIPWLKTNTKGDVLAPAGGCRDMFLHVQDHYLEKSIDFLINTLGESCEVYKTEDLIAQGLFGPVISDVFTMRVGNIVILPKTDASVWWYEKDRFEISYMGHHGGLSRSEAETLLACRTFK